MNCSLFFLYIKSLHEVSIASKQQWQHKV